MLIGQRLAERMQIAQLSQAELARRVGMSQQAVGKLVNGESRSSPNLHKIARELGTTPAYLAGETDDPDAGAPSPPTLSAAERELLDCFKALELDEQRSLLHVARSMSGRS